MSFTRNLIRLLCNWFTLLSLLRWWWRRRQTVTVGACIEFQLAYYTNYTRAEKSLSPFDSVVASNKIQSNLYYANEHIISEGEKCRGGHALIHSRTEWINARDCNEWSEEEIFVFEWFALFPSFLFSSRGAWHGSWKETFYYIPAYIRHWDEVNSIE